jgi:Fe2+ transport system protein FeoA
MIVTVDQAPCDIPLLLTEINDPSLADRLARIGVLPGDELTRLHEEAVLGSARVLGPHGEVVLAGGMAAKIITHHDDGHKTPLIEMQPGEAGHVEGLICGSALAEGLEIMGIREGDPIRMIRRVPPMSYLALVEKRRVQLTEGAATKIWGRLDGQFVQFALAGRNRPFQVQSLLGGRRATAILHKLGILPGQILTLQEVTPAHCVGEGHRDQVVLVMESGLRLYLRLDQAKTVHVLPSYMALDHSSAHGTAATSNGNTNHAA